MRKTLAVSVTTVAIAFVAAGAWMISGARQSKAESEKYAQWSREQKMVPVHFEVTVPPGTPVDQTLYISGDASSLGNWDAAGVPLQREPDGKYRATVELMTGIAHGYKVTRGTWGTVERGPTGGEIPDHMFTADKETTLTCPVQTWVDNGKTVPGRVTLTGDIRLHKKFHSALLGDDRTLIVYLPPTYEQSKSDHFPVLYMHDGQNLFDSSTSFAGVEWRADETAQQLILDGKMTPVIIVGVYNTPDRTDQFIGSKRDLYGRFLVEEVKPFIDKHYRTLADRQHTALAGASMGALTTIYIAKAHPEAFSTIALLDPFLRTGQDPDGTKLLVDDLLSGGWAREMHWYIDMGSDGAGNYPGSQPAADGQALAKGLEAAGLKKGSDFVFQESPGAQHNEASWVKRIDKLFLNLYGKTQAT